MPRLWFIKTCNNYIKTAVCIDQRFPMCIQISAARCLNSHMVAHILQSITAGRTVSLSFQKNIPPVIIVQLIVRCCTNVPCRLFCFFFCAHGRSNILFLKIGKYSIYVDIHLWIRPHCCRQFSPILQNSRYRCCHTWINIGRSKIQLQ